MKILDNLMHAPCAICGNGSQAEKPRSFWFGGRVTSICRDMCMEEFARRVEECFAHNYKPLPSAWDKQVERFYQ